MLAPKLEGAFPRQARGGLLIGSARVRKEAMRRFVSEHLDGCALRAHRLLKLPELRQRNLRVIQRIVALNRYFHLCDQDNRTPRAMGGGRSFQVAKERHDGADLLGSRRKQQSAAPSKTDPCNPPLAALHERLRLKITHPRLQIPKNTLV